MAVTPGSASKVNVLAGISKVMSFTAADLTSFGERVLEKGILLVDEARKVYLTDGVTALKNLTPIVDQLLIAREKEALLKTFSGTDGAYKATEGGFLVLGADGQMAEESLPKDFMVDGKVNIEKLPDAVRAKISYVADIAARDAVTDEQKKGLVFVIDATGDSTVEQGSAMYAWVDNAWTKIAEIESLDLDVDSIKASTENVEAAGAVMYNHTVMLTPPSMTDFAALVDATAAAETESSTEEGA